MDERTRGGGTDGVRQTSWTQARAASHNDAKGERMTGRIRLLLAAALTLVSLAAATGTAGASFGLRIEPGGPIEARGRVTFRGGAGTEIWCNVTLTGDFNRLVTKTVGAAFGTFTNYTTRECAGNEFIIGVAERRFLTPIPIQYNSFLGTLPNITGVLVRLAPLRFKITEREGGRTVAECLYEGVVGALMPIAGGEIERMSFLEADRIRLRGERSIGIENCEAEGRLIGTLTISPRQRVTLLDR